MLFPVASLFSGNATVKAIDKLPLFKQGIKRMHDLKSTPMLASDYLYSGYVQTRCNLPCSRDDLSAAIVRCIVSAAGSYISAFLANRMIDLKKV